MIISKIAIVFNLLFIVVYSIRGQWGKIILPTIIILFMILAEILIKRSGDIDG